MGVQLSHLGNGAGRPHHLACKVGARRQWGEGKWLVFAAVVFAAGVILRDSPVVVFLDSLGILISLSLAVWLVGGGSLRRAGIFDYALGGSIPAP